MLGEATASYVARLPRRSSPEPMAMASGERQPAPSRRKTTPLQPEVCPLCHGAGYVRLDVPVGHPDFGRAVLCKCKEREIEERERLQLRKISESLAVSRGALSIPSIPRSPTWRRPIRSRCATLQDPAGWLIFQGGYGCGKTHLAAAIAHVREDAGDTVFFSIVPELLDHLRAAFAPTSELTYDALFERVRETGLLVLDDLGAENATAWATEKLFQLINHRYNYRMPTVITTNVAVDVAHGRAYHARA